MPIIFVMLFGAALAGMFAQSPALRAETPGAIRAANRFANYWLRRLIAICAIWPIILISIALMGGEKIVLVLTFVPLAAAIYAAIVIPQTIWLAPAAANAILEGIGKMTSGIANAFPVDILPKSLRAPVDMPKLPETKTLLWPVAVGLIGNCLLGLFLRFAHVAQDRELLFILILISVPIGLLAIFSKGKKLRKLLTFAAMIIVLIFILGGRNKAETNVEAIVAEAKGSSTTPAIQAIKPPPASYENRDCTEREAIANDLSRRKFESGESFTYELNGGKCFAKLVLPNGPWDRKAAEPHNPGDWFSAHCDGKFVPPVLITTEVNLSCGGVNFFFQGEGKLVFTRGRD